MRAWVRLWVLSAPGWGRGGVSGEFLVWGGGGRAEVGAVGAGTREESIPEANCTKASLKGFLSRPAMLCECLSYRWNSGVVMAFFRLLLR